MANYDGFRIRCGCHCGKCGATVVLEGYSDASGSHYCGTCDDYVSTYGNCSARTPEKIKQREKIIIENGALDD